MPGCLVISRNHGATPDQLRLEQALVVAAAQAGVEGLALPDLYHLPDESPLWERLRQLPAPVVVAGWLEARALEALLATRGVASPQGAISLLHCADASAALAQATAITGTGDPVAGAAPLEETCPERWYPVLDSTRCTNCHHCYQFCLFGVYELDVGGTVRVSQPDSCKPGCPACARICPASAILFPLYSPDPAISGAPGCLVVPDEDAAVEFRQRLQDKRAQAQSVPVLAEIDDLIARLEDLAGEDAQ